jgi:membrane protease YdiL (CAAX protease family)
MSAEIPSQTATFPRKLFVVLYLAGLVGAVSSIPAMLELIRPLLSSVPPPDVPLVVLVTLGAAQHLLILALIVGFGIKLSRRVGLGAPYLEAILDRRKPTHALAHILKPALLSGVLLGITLTVVLLILTPHLPNLAFVSVGKIAIWKRVLLCFYGGIYEELLMRLLLLSLFVWLLSRGWKRRPIILSANNFWVANIIVAVLFGLGHLPAASLVMTITPFVVAVALLLNGVAAITFGLLYRKRGLEAAVVSHCVTDFLIYVIGPSFLKS